MNTMSKNSCIIFSDLDGTLLCCDTYSFEGATPALEFLRKKNVPLVFCSSKTKAEIMHYRKKLNNYHPFISENGGAIFIPVGYKGFEVDYTRVEGDYWVIELGTRREVLLKALESVCARTVSKIRGFSDMNAEEVARLTGLPQEEARLALERHYSEPFFIMEGDPRAVLREIENMGLQWTSGGRFLHVIGRSDKGRAVRLLSDIYKNNARDIDWITIGCGDSLNDLPMLKAVDKAVLLKNLRGVYDPGVRVPGLLYEENGPVGWGEAVLRLIQQYGPTD